jgi:hypothetical protein
VVTETEKYSILHSVRDRIAWFEFWDNGITYIKLDDGITVELEDAKRHLNILQSRYNGKDKFKVLVDPGKYTNLSKEAREFSGRPESNALTTASAVMVRTLAHRILINFMINFVKKQTMKMRMFDNKEKAIHWLLAQKI